MFKHVQNSQHRKYLQEKGFLKIDTQTTNNDTYQQYEEKIGRSIFYILPPSTVIYTDSQGNSCRPSITYHKGKFITTFLASGNNIECTCLSRVPDEKDILSNERF